MTIIEEPSGTEGTESGSAAGRRSASGAAPAPAATVAGSTLYQMTLSERRFVGAHLAIAIVALMVGSLMGPLQSFQFSGLDLYPYQ